MTERTKPASKDKPLSASQIKSLVEEELRPTREEFARVADPLLHARMRMLKTLPVQSLLIFFRKN